MKRLRRPDCPEELLAQPPDVGTSNAVGESVARADEDRAAGQPRIDQFIKTDETFDTNAPRPSPRRAL